MIDPELLINALRDSRRGPLRARDLAKALAVTGAGYPELKTLLARLEEEGRVYRVRGNRYAAPDKINLVTGRLSTIRSGDAFVSTREGEEDLFIPSHSLDSAMDGDQVVARIEGRPRGRNPIGRVIKVLERAHPTVVGRFERGRKVNSVRPLNPRLGGDVIIPPGDEGEARSGELVVVRVVYFGDRNRSALGEVERVLGAPDAPGVDVLAVLHSHNLPTEFPPEVDRWVEREGHRLAREGGPGREDLRSLPVYTIDPADARDHDDALSIIDGPGDLVEVGVHIADVSHFVPAGSPPDVEALRRGTSVYLVDQVVPMLPHALSSDLCSLRPGEDRFALSLFVLLDRQGRVRSHRFQRTLIRNRAHLTYQDVEGLLDRPSGETDPGDEERAAMVATLQRLHEFAQILRERRLQRGSLDFDLPEARVVLDRSGAPIDIQRVVQLRSHRLVEDFMLLANEVVAREAVNRLLPLPFRVHEPPASQRLDQIRPLLASLGHRLPLKKVRPRDLQRILEDVKGRPEENLVSTVLLRTMAKARYDGENQGHFGLASRAYTHFTSPIRRYPDLMVHRVIGRAIVDGHDLPEAWGGEALQEASEQASRREKVAQAAERDSVDMKKVEFMERHLGEEFSGTISGVVAFGFFVLLDDFFVDGLVHVSALEDDYYEFQENRYLLRGQRSGRVFRLGDRVRVGVARVDKEDRKVDFLLVSLEPRHGGESPAL